MLENSEITGSFYKQATGVQDGDNINNVLVASGEVPDLRTMVAKKRLLSEGGAPTEEERKQILEYLNTL